MPEPAVDLDAELLFLDENVEKLCAVCEPRRLSPTLRETVELPRLRISQLQRRLRASA